MRKSLLSFHDNEEEEADAAVLPTFHPPSKTKNKKIRLSQQGRPGDIPCQDFDRLRATNVEADYYSAENLHKLKQEQRFANIAIKASGLAALSGADDLQSGGVMIDAVGDHVSPSASTAMGEEELIIMDGEELEMCLDDDGNLVEPAPSSATAAGTLRGASRKGTLSTKEAIANDSNANYINDDFIPFSRNKTSSSSRVYMAGDVESSASLGKKLGSSTAEEENDDDLEWDRVVQRKALVKNKPLSGAHNGDCITIGKMIDILSASKEKLRRKSEFNGERIAGIEKEIADIENSFDGGNKTKLNEKVDSYNYFADFRTYVFELVYMLREKKAAINAVRRAVIRSYVDRRAAFVQKLRFLQRNLLHVCQCVDANSDSSTEDIILYNNNKLSLEQCLASSGATIADLISSNVDVASSIEYSAASSDPHPLARGDIADQIAGVFSDARSELVDLKLIMKRLDGFRSSHPDYYRNAFFSLCIPQILVPFVELDVLSFYNRSLGDNSVIDLKQMRWFESVKQYTLDGELEHGDEIDATLLPKLVLVAMVPFFAEYIKGFLNPLDAKVCVEVSETINLLLNFQPNTQDVTLIVGSVVDIFSHYVNSHNSGDSGVFIMPNFARYRSQQSKGIIRYFRGQLSMLTRIFENFYLFKDYINCNVRMRVGWALLTSDENISNMMAQLAESEEGRGEVSALLCAVAKVFPPQEDLIAADLASGGPALAKRLLECASEGAGSKVANLLRDALFVDIFKKM